jgi:hypothetical protein
LERKELRQETDIFSQEKEIKTVYVSEIIKKGWIEWQDPKQLENLGLTTEEVYRGTEGVSDVAGVFSGGVKYFKVGEIIQGNFAGSDLLLIQSFIQEGSGFNMDFHRVIRNDRGEFIFLLGYHGGGVEREWEQSNLEQMIKRYFSQKENSTFKSYRIKIEELSYPVKIAISGGWQELEMDSSRQAFFSKTKLKRVFKHPQWGQVWITNSGEFRVDPSSEKNELNSYSNKSRKQKDQRAHIDIFGAGGLYIKAPDGTAVTYRLNLDHLLDSRGVLQATWSNGQLNEGVYRYQPADCKDSGLFVYDWSQKVDPSDLKWIGKTKRGTALYGFRSIESQELEEFFQKELLVRDRMNQEEGEVLSKYPVVFWRDPFGRRLAFLREEFVPEEECN